MKKALGIIGKIFIWLVIIMAVSMMIFTLVSVATFNKTDRNLFGYQAYIVNTDSMSKTDFNAGDLILTKQVNPSTLVEGDIITFLSQNPESFGQTVTHKIRRLTVDADGHKAFITYGTTTDSDDSMPVTYPYVLGKYVAKIPLLGHLFAFLKTTPGYIVCIFVPFLLLIIYYGLRCIKLFRRYKKEQSAGIEEERKRLEEERKQTEETMRQLRELQAMLEQQKNAGEAQESAAPSSGESSANGGSDPDSHTV